MPTLLRLFLLILFTQAPACVQADTFLSPWREPRPFFPMDLDVEEGAPTPAPAPLPVPPAPTVYYRYLAPPPPVIQYQPSHYPLYQPQHPFPGVCLPGRG